MHAFQTNLWRFDHTFALIAHEQAAYQSFIVLVCVFELIVIGLLTVKILDAFIACEGCNGADIDMRVSNSSWARQVATTIC